jgi:hypothetical protein
MVRVYAQMHGQKIVMDYVPYVQQDLQEPIVINAHRVEPEQDVRYVIAGMV